MSLDCEREQNRAVAVLPGIWTPYPGEINGILSKLEENKRNQYNQKIDRQQDDLLRQQNELAYRQEVLNYQQHAEWQYAEWQHAEWQRAEWQRAQDQRAKKQPFYPRR